MSTPIKFSRSSYTLCNRNPITIIKNLKVQKQLNNRYALPAQQNIKMR